MGEESGVLHQGGSKLSYRIASFNLKNFSLATDKDLNRIAAIIKESNFDIIAMQEVLAAGRALSGIYVKDPAMQKSAFEKSLLGRLGRNWNSFWGDPKTASKYYPYLGRDNRGEGYAFIWNTDRIDLMKVPNNPRIFREYKTDFGNGAFRLIRDPLYGRFKVRGTKIELRLITTHIISGKPKEDSMRANFEGGAVALRKHEFDILAGSVYKRINDYRKDTEPTVPYTIMLGDYNLNLLSSGIGKMILSDVAYYASNGNPLMGFEQGCEVVYTVQNEKTTLSDHGYANNFDHFSFNEKTKQIVNKWKRIDAVHQNIKPGDNSEEALFNRYYCEVSDHVPVVIELQF